MDYCKERDRETQSKNEAQTYEPSSCVRQNTRLGLNESNRFCLVYTTPLQKNP